MNKKGDVTLLQVLIGLIVGIMIVFIVFPIGSKLYASERIDLDENTLSSIHSLPDAIEMGDNYHFFGVGRDFYIVFFDKGSGSGHGGFNRPEKCFDVNKACICACYKKGDKNDYCSSEKNKEGTVCKAINVDKFVLEGFSNEYLEQETYRVSLSKSVIGSETVIKIVNNI